MKKTIISLAIALCTFALLTFSGCASAPSASATVGTITSPTALRFATSTGAMLELYHNPASLPAATALSAGIEQALAGETILTPEIITKFVRTICEKNHLPPLNTAVYVNLAQNIYRAYADTHPAAVIKITDPTVRTYVKAFEDGLNDAIASVATAAFST